jgi:UDP-N-acetylmuramoyl-L-alanyl-D-glutamate--2,6-diaminopimelate ligase
MRQDPLCLFLNKMEHQTRIPISTLFAEAPINILAGKIDDTDISGITMDSRLVNPGCLFVAMQGASVDGHEFIPGAIQHGASVIVGEKPLEGLPVPYIRVKNSRQALPWLAAAFYGYPGRKLTVIGVTGTDGKTTTCNLLFQILLAAGYKTGLISTVNAIIGDKVLDTGFHVTTPDAPDVQAYMARMVEAGLTHVVIETTSHGLAQHRVDACEFDVGIITNITHEHLDQHGSFANYRNVKARLFRYLDKTRSKPQGNPRLSVLNKDDKSYKYLSRFAPGPQTSYGLDPSADFRAESIVYSQQGIRFDVVGKGFRVPVTSSMVGLFNVSNCLAALTAAVKGLNINPKTVVQGIATLKGVPGRMERIDLGQSFTAIVDFAHTPNALHEAIETIRMLTNGKVIVVFGSAGLRDKEKRHMMAETSTELADVSIFTAEDPRTESLGKILDEMAAGACKRGGVEERTFFRVLDRGEAIRLGVRLAEPGDIVMVCGKGHEQSMCFGTTEYPWDDRTAMRAALAEQLGIEGPQMPYLPPQRG